MEPDKQTRYTVVVGKLAQARLASIAKQFKISQGAVMEVMIENVDVQALEEQFKARREQKVQSRGSKTELLEKIKKLTPEQRAYLESLGT
jgi:Spy/CpxP family protein refolding chaperone